jgi:tRNA-dihydrouridine synthase B
MNFKWSELKKPVFVLAPMANITTLPFRSICKEFGADIVFTPMLSSNAIVYNPNETYKIGEFLTEEQPVIVQIFGYDGDIIAKAANMVQEKLNPAGIDINMGCPAPKITGNECGSGLLRDYDKALAIIKTVRNSYKGQLSVKIRLGWRDYDVLPFLKQLEEIGIDAITVHGRTTKQGYSGEADWSKINEIASTLSIPVIGNGDITTWEDAISRSDNSNLAGIMIGRGALERPWIFQEIKNNLSSLRAQRGSLEYSPAQLADLIEKQASLAIRYLDNEKLAIIEMRKFFGWYLKGFPYAKALRTPMMQIESMDELNVYLDKLRGFEK